MLVQILLIHLAVIPTIFGHSLGYMVSGITALILNCLLIMRKFSVQGFKVLQRANGGRSLSWINA